MLVDQGLTLIFVLVGQAATKTSVAYYCRKWQNASIGEVEQLWTTSKMDYPDAKTPKINPISR